MPGGGGISPGQDVLNGLRLLLNFRELKRPPCKMGVSRKCTLSTFHVSARFRQRWSSWASKMDIVWLRHQPRLRTNLVQFFSVLWPGVLAGWHASHARRRQLPSSYRPWTGYVYASARWRHFVGTAIACSTWGIFTSPLAAPPSRVVRV